MVSSPVNALTAQHRLADWLEDTKHSFEARYVFMSLFNNVMNPLQKGLDRDMAETTAAHMRHERRMLRDGQPVFVTEEVMDLVDEAVEEMPSEVLLRDDLPFDELVLWFERPMEYHAVVDTVLDGVEQEITEHWEIDAIGFSYRPLGVVPAIPPDRRGLERQAFIDEEKENATDGVMAHLYCETSKTPKLIGHINPILVGPYSLIDTVAIAFDVDWASRAWLEDTKERTSVRKVHKWLIALFRLMGEHVEISEAPLPRQTLRALQRSGKEPPKDGYLSLMHLRKIAYDVDGETDTGRRLRWKHRVRGHWQRFYCRSRGYPVGHPYAYRHRYVNSYVRGPGDVIESERVVVVDR